MCSRRLGELELPMQFVRLPKLSGERPVQEQRVEPQARERLCEVYRMPLPMRREFEQKRANRRAPHLARTPKLSIRRDSLPNCDG